MIFYHIQLFSDVRPHTSGGAGWYVNVFTTSDGEGEAKVLCKPQRIGGHAALKVAAAIDDVLQHEEGDPTIFGVVTSGNELVNQTLQQQIAFAEEQARRVAHLRRLASQEVSLPSTLDVDEPYPPNQKDSMPGGMQ